MELRTRRQFLRDSLGLGAALAGGSMLPPPVWARESSGRSKLPVAGVVTEYRNNTHADVILGKILEGFKQDGGPGPALELVSLYTDQIPKNDMSRDLAGKHGFRIAETIEDAVTVGTNGIPVAGVLCIGEHGNYPFTPDTRQHMYPRRRFFDEVVACFRKYDKVVPVFNDKHLAYAWDDAYHMYQTAREMKIPFLAGSSIPVAWRRPALTIPRGTALESAFALGYGGVEAYGFHALEGLQCMVERRGKGETGVASVRAVKGDQIDAALAEGEWSQELFDAAVATTPPPPRGRPMEMRKESVFFLIEYRDGLRAAVAMETGMAHEFAFAARVAGKSEPLATWIQLQNGKPYGHFGYLVRAIEELVHTGHAPYPVERTLLTTGILDAAMHSLAKEGQRLETPHLAVEYEPAEWPFAPGVPEAPMAKR